MRPIGTSGDQLALTPEEWEEATEWQYAYTGPLWASLALLVPDLGFKDDERYQRYGTIPSTGEVLVVRRPVYVEGE